LSKLLDLGTGLHVLVLLVLAVAARFLNRLLRGRGGGGEEMRKEGRTKRRAGWSGKRKGGRQCAGGGGERERQNERKRIAKSKCSRQGIERRWAREDGEEGRMGRK
jgi:hypothetical protein